MSDELGVVNIPTITWGAGIRSATGLDFSEATRTAIDNALRDVPIGHTTAVLEVGLKAIQAIVATKQPLWGGKAQWTVGAYVGKAWNGPVDAGVRLAFSF